MIIEDILFSVYQAFSDDLFIWLRSDIALIFNYRYQLCKFVTAFVRAYAAAMTKS
ncbi:hypothetical protein HMPREF9016_00856 [Neisseria sp. oral taxon 014 str. F0314]|nr:hypothetical protein HMPREF9016_00856 [Neisseria sp. oral taxon 014 str. F0314]